MALEINPNHGSLILRTHGTLRNQYVENRPLQHVPQLLVSCQNLFTEKHPTLVTLRHLLVKILSLLTPSVEMTGRGAGPRYLLFCQLGTVKPHVAIFSLNSGSLKQLGKMFSPAS